jgi:hypothetical protein
VSGSATGLRQDGAPNHSIDAAAPMGSETGPGAAPVPPSAASAAAPSAAPDGGDRNSPGEHGGKPEPPPSSETSYKVPEGGGYLIFWYLLLLAGFPFGLVVYDMAKAYAFATHNTDKLLQCLGPRVTADQLKILATELQQAPPGVPGLARSTLAFTLLIILGIAVFHLVMFGGPGFNTGETGKLVHDLLMLLATLRAPMPGGRRRASTRSRVCFSIVVANVASQFLTRAFKGHASARRPVCRSISSRSVRE